MIHDWPDVHDRERARVRGLIDRHERLVLSEDGIPCAVPSPNIGRVVADVQDAIEPAGMRITKIEGVEATDGQTRLMLEITETPYDPQVVVE